MARFIYRGVPSDIREHSDTQECYSGGQVMMDVQLRTSLMCSLTKRLIPCIIVAVLVSIALGSARPVNASGHDTQSARIHFIAHNPLLGMSLDFAADLSWDEVLRVTRGDAVPIGYDFSPGPASLAVFLPLGDYLWLFGVKDASFNIPLGDMPLEKYSTSLTELLGVPKLIASVNMVIEPSLAMTGVTCSEGQDHIAMDASTLTWKDWSSKNIQFHSDEPGEAIVSASFTYTLSFSITLTMLANLIEYNLVPGITLLRLSGSDQAVTTINVELPVPSLWDRYGTVSLSFVVEGCAIAVVLIAAKRIF